MAVSTMLLVALHPLQAGALGLLLHDDPTAKTAPLSLPDSQGLMVPAAQLHYNDAAWLAGATPHAYTSTRLLVSFYTYPHTHVPLT